MKLRLHLPQLYLNPRYSLFFIYILLSKDFISFIMIHNFSSVYVWLLVSCWLSLYPSPALATASLRVIWFMLGHIRSQVLVFKIKLLLVFYQTFLLLFWGTLAAQSACNMSQSTMKLLLNKSLFNNQDQFWGGLSIIQDSFYMKQCLQHLKRVYKTKWHFF